MTFDSFKLIHPLLKALEKGNFLTPTPIQEMAIPVLMEGKDLMAFAQTGTGKTAAFLLPLLQKVYKNNRNGIKALILTPTRELAQQTGEAIYLLGKYMDVAHAVIYGGVPHDEQIEMFRGQVDIVVATPGRLLDLLGRNALKLDQVNTFVLDEADRMLDMGFIEDVQRILSTLPPKRQSMLFSATMSPTIAGLADVMLSEPERVFAAPTASASELIEQKVYYIEKQNKPSLLIDFLRKEEVKTAIVFTKTRKSADALHIRLQEAGFSSDRLHSDRSQHARDTILMAFRNGELPILVATDIAARGIDVAHLTHVFNYELPQEAETYIHRVGRTGRAGKEGIAITLCEPDDKAMLGDIQKLMRKCIPVVENHTYATLALKQALEVADLKIAGKAVAKKGYKGSKANGDYFRRQKMAQRKGKNK